MGFLKKRLSLAIAVIILCNNLVSSERWSRQLTPNLPASPNDWVPIRNAKSLSFAEDLQAAAQTQFQFFAEPANNRFNLQQTHPAHSAASPSEINSFTSINSPPQFQFFNSPQKTRTVQNFGGPLSNKPVADSLIQSPPPFQFMQEIQRGPHVHHYQSQPIPKSLQNFPQSPVIPQFQTLPGQPRLPTFQTLPPPPAFQPVPTRPPFQPLPSEPQTQTGDQVQLLYVPYDSLYQQGQQPQTDSFADTKTNNRFNILNQPVSASLINDFYSQNEVQEFPVKPATTRKPVTTNRPTIAPTTSSFRLTTPFETTTKPKPHQPPLSMFVAIDKFKGKVTEADVLSTLRSSNSIDVMDAVTKNAPKVFIGPSGMDAPAGYSKFDLPYLSSIEGTRHERRIEQLPFFVAPLSYKTPPGFSKIPLPAPHVGSVVVNQPSNSIESNENEGFTQNHAQNNYYTKQPVLVNSQKPVNQPQKTHQKVTLTSGFNYGPSGNVQLIKNEFSFPATLTPSVSQEVPSRSIFTTPRPTFAQTALPLKAETPLTKVAYKHIEEQRNYGHSTLSPTTTRAATTKTKLDYFPTSPRSTGRTPTTKSSYIELEEHKTVNEEYFGIQKEKKPTFSFKFGSEVDKPSQSFKFDTDEEPQKPSQNFNFRPLPEEPTKKPAQNFNFRPIPEEPAKKPSQNFNFRPIPDFDFGDKEDFTTTRKPRTKMTTQPPTTEALRTVSQYSFPSSTASPTTAFEFTPTVSEIENTAEYGQVNGGSDGNFFEYRSSSRPTQDYTFNRFNFGNENTFTQDKAYTPQQYVQEHSNDFREHPEQVDVSTTENPSYSLPSELPSISPQLPGWINSLMEDEWMQKVNITDEPVTTTVATTTTSRRTVNRGSRRPVTSTYRATATESTVERRPATSRRRPSTQYTSRNSAGTTEAPATFPSRATASRGTKVKYNATTEERSKFRTRNRNNPTLVKKEEENIEYQRDVLNQNYPSVRPVLAEPSTEKPEEGINIRYQTEVATPDHNLNDYNAPLESVEVIPLGGNDNSENSYTPKHRPSFYENPIETSTLTTTSTTTTQETPLPSNHKHSNSFVEQTPIPRVNRLKANFHFKNRNIDSFYNTNSQDTSTKRPEPQDDDLSITVPTTQATTRQTEAAPTDSPIPRRTNFPRRRVLYTTTEASTTSDNETTESTAGRTKSRKENVVVVKKVRGRVRQTTTTTESPETTRRTVAVRTRSQYNNANRSTNRESSRQRDSENNEEVKPRFRIRENTQRFRLDTQESQWSSKFNQNAFQPLDESKSKALKDQVDDEQEIITAGPEGEKDTYLVNVSASVLPTKPAQPIEDVDETINMITTTTEKDVALGKKIKNEDKLGSSFEQFVKEVLEDIDEDSKSESKIEKKPVGTEKKSPRRGVWKRIKVRPAEGFETAESQYIGNKLYNSVSDSDKTEGEKHIEKAETTTAKIEEPEPTKIVTTEKIPLEHVFSETTTVEPEIEESKPGMFDEARKALTELFSTEDDSDDAANMDEADEKLEALRESTTTAVPTTEETTTLLPTVEVTTTATTKAEGSVKASKQVRTSTSQKVTGEICYRGRCIKTEEQ